MGFYEAIDYTKDRLAPGSERAIVKTYMAHHHGMSLVALNNCLNANVMQSRFHADPRVQAAELLLQERSPHLVPLDRPPDEHKVEEAPGRIVQSLVRRYVTPHTVTPRAHLLSNGSMSVMMTNSGRGYTRWRDVAVTRWREDSTCDALGQRSATSAISRPARFWSSGFQPSGREADSYEVTFAPDRAVIRRRDEGIETFTEIDRLAGRRCGDPPRLGDQSLARDPRARADQLRRGRPRAAGRRPRAPGLQQPLHRVDAGAGAGRRHLHAAAARARAPALHGACAGGARTHWRWRRVRDRSRAFHWTRRDACGSHQRCVQRAACPARRAPCSIRSSA